MSSNPLKQRDWMVKKTYHFDWDLAVVRWIKKLTRKLKGKSS